jgi:hypothetical protein
MGREKVVPNLAFFEIKKPRHPLVPQREPDGEEGG